MAVSIALVLLGGPATAGAVDWTEVDLGIHEFGHLAVPDDIVAIAGPTEVGFENPQEGSSNGPWSFDVAADGSIWLLDQFNYRVLEWEPGRPDAASLTVPLPQEVIRIAADMAIGPNGTIYLSFVPVTPPDDREMLMVIALSATGNLLWTTPTDIQYFNSRLRMAPDGSVYWEGALDTDDSVVSGLWTPVTSPDGEPLSLDEQRAGSGRYQPLSDDLRFEAEEAGEGAEHEWDFTLIDQNDGVVGAWRVTSEDELGGTVDEPGTAGGDPIVTLGIARQSADDYLYEYVAIRLPVGGGSPEEISLDPNAAWSDVPVTGLRVGPDGALYQLRSDIETGVTIAKYTLGSLTEPTPEPSPSTTAPPEPTGAPTTAPPVAAPMAPASSRSMVPWILGALMALVVVGGGGGLLLWRRAARSR
jgi:hypothetical protein